MTLAAVVVNLPHRTPVWVDIVYLAAAVAFIVALKGLSSPKQARNGNLLAAAAAIVAVAVTFFNPVARFAATPPTWCWPSWPWCSVRLSPCRWRGW